MENNYKRTIAGSVGAGVGALLNADGRKFYILEHKTESKYHHVGESQKIIVDQIEMGRDSSCQVRFDDSMETVSRRHAAIVRDGDNYKLIPMSQTNATLVNGQPVSGEWHLNSGDEIRLSSRGPVMGFIIPQGKKAMVNSIGLTERMSLFRQQALRPYKRALVALLVVFVVAVGALVAWNLYQNKQAQEVFEQQQAAMAAQQAEINAQQAAMAAQQAEINAQQAVLEEQKAHIEAQQQQIAEAEEASRQAQEELATNLQLSNAEREKLQKQVRSTSAKISEMTNTLNSQLETYQQNMQQLESKVKESEAMREELEATKAAIEESNRREAEKQAAEEAAKKKAEEKSLKIYTDDTSDPVINKSETDKTVLKKF